MNRNFTEVCADIETAESIYRIEELDKEIVRNKYHYSLNQIKQMQTKLVEKARELGQRDSVMIKELFKTDKT